MGVIILLIPPEQAVGIGKLLLDNGIKGRVHRPPANRIQSGGGSEEMQILREGFRENARIHRFFGLGMNIPVPNIQISFAVSGHNTQIILAAGVYLPDDHILATGQKGSDFAGVQIHPDHFGLILQACPMPICAQKGEMGQVPLTGDLIDHLVVLQNCQGIVAAALG